MRVTEISASVLEDVYAMRHKSRGYVPYYGAVNLKNETF